MSFFGGPARSQGGMSPERVDAIMTEMEMVSDVFNRMISSCHAKCISTRYTDAELTKGESVCIDRCVGKYFEANKIVGEELNKLNQQAGGAGGAGPLGM
ncbi:hypothetical protein PENSPDRAFT_645250 [Peniophora sp. CONT]|nr:hypothetical protein PENSPDRAFT_645250 [Peniophora sp. CONT]